MADECRTVTLSVASRDDVVRRIGAALGGEAQGDFITFTTVELLWKLITPKRLDILRVLAGQKALSIREAARRLGRDVKAVHGDVRALVDAGLLDETGSGVRFDYDTIHVDFTLRAA
ncbi:transcriptional regulator [soil metagenome]